MKKEYPQVTYGAVYFRKSDPPRADWERDYKQAAKDGMNMFRHWFLWGAIEKAPGVYDWSEYDRQLDLAAENGIGTIIAEFSDCAPEWFYHENRNCFSMFRDGTQAAHSGMGASCNTGGFIPGGLCLDNEKSRAHVEGFLRALAERYKGHPGLFGYDVWNECNYNPDTCFCEHTQKRFQEWLQEKYSSLDSLSEVWKRYGYTSWDQIKAPRYVDQTPDCMDWLQFRKENYYRNYKWKADIIRSIDPDAHITAHGVAASLDYTYGDGNDDWLAAQQVESYGMTWVMGRKGTEPWKQWHAVDLVRAASRGKTFWHAEMQGGPLWLQPQVVGRAKEDGRVATAPDVRLWNLASLAGGARGIQYLRWRSLLAGQLFSSFGLYSDDGLPNDRSEVVASLAKWANSPETRDLFSAQPARSTIGIIIDDQIQEFNRLIRQAGPGKFYANCQWGAYRMFFENRTPADFVHIDDIAEYKTLYFAYPILLTASRAAQLIEWVKNGGRLICEGLPGYFTDHGRVCPVRPGNGLASLFGALENSVEFMPDIADSIRFSAFGISDIPGGYFRQGYTATTGEVLGTYPGGEPAVIRNHYGKGTTLLIGTYPSAGYMRESSQLTRLLASRLLDLTDSLPPVTISGCPHIHYRLCESDNRRFLWLLNHAPAPGTVRLNIPAFKSVLRGSPDAVSIANGALSVVVPGKDAVIVEVE